MNSAPGAGKEEMVAAWKNPSPPGPEEEAAGEAVAAHIILLAASAAAAWSPRAGQADTRAHTQPFSNDDGSGSGLSLQQPGDYKDSDDLLLLLLLLFLLPRAPPSPLLGPLI